MMNENVLLEDIRIRRKIKGDELASLSMELKNLEARKVALEETLQGYDTVILSLELEQKPVLKAPGPLRLSSERGDRLDIAEDILSIFDELDDGVDALGTIEGLFIEDVQKHLQAKGVPGALNTVTDRILRLEKEGKLFQLNAPQKRYRRYARKPFDAV